MEQMAQALASSNLHREQGSAIHSLHQQVVALSEFQPPASRIVGLVGDSGVGKSSLINSLLDLEGFARAVRYTESTFENLITSGLEQ
jgi:putative ribosome biogenesis GTPase RsgA